MATWRQVANGYAEVDAGVMEGFLAVGPLRAGGMLLQLEWYGHSAYGTRSPMGFVLSGSAAPSPEAFSTGNPLIQQSTLLAFGGVPCIRLATTGLPYNILRVAQAVRIDAGSVFVHGAWTGNASHLTGLFLSVLVVGDE